MREGCGAGGGAAQAQLSGATFGHYLDLTVLILDILSWPWISSASDTAYFSDKHYVYFVLKKTEF